MPYGRGPIMREGDKREAFGSSSDSFFDFVRLSTSLLQRLRRVEG